MPREGIWWQEILENIGRKNATRERERSSRRDLFLQYLPLTPLPYLTFTPELPSHRLLELGRHQAVHVREISKKGRVRTLKVYIYSNPENSGAQHDTIKQPRSDSPLCSCSNFTAQLIVHPAPLPCLEARANATAHMFPYDLPELGRQLHGAELSGWSR